MRCLVSLWATCAFLVSALVEDFDVPFAQAAIFAAELPRVRDCDNGPSSSCKNPFLAMTAWRYASNNLRRAVANLPESERQMHKSTIALIAQISAEIEAFFKEPTAETMMIAVGNARQVFDALKEWMTHSPPTRMQLDSDFRVGLPFLYGGRSLRLPSHPQAQPGDAEVRLGNGVEMPVLGFGTWQLMGQQCFEATLHALKIGYRHVDTAQSYGNEAEVGRALAAAGLPRHELFLVTKLSNPEEYTALRARFEAQLRELRTDYLDLYMLHSPGPGASSEATRAAWQSMEQLYHEGRIRALGVSNFGPEELENLLSYATLPPVYVQNKFSVYTPGEQRVNHDLSIMSYLKDKNIVMMGYSVINPWPGVIPPLQDPHVTAISDRKQKTPSQVLHRWALQLGAGVIPKSASAARIEENARLFDFSLSDAEMRLLSGIVTLVESTVSNVAPKWVEDSFSLVGD